MKIKDIIIGKEYNKLTVIGSPVRILKNGYAKGFKVPVRCRCGKRYYIRTSVLGKTKSCGCSGYIARAKLTTLKLYSHFLKMEDVEFDFEDVQKATILNRRIYEKKDRLFWVDNDVDIMKYIYEVKKRYRQEEKYNNDAVDVLHRLYL